MNPTELATHLRAAKALINTPKKWTQGTLARCGTVLVSLADPYANCFCSVGAAARYARDTEPTPFNATKLRHALFAALDDAVVRAGWGGEGIISYNDNHTHAEVMAVWDTAIATAEAGDVPQ